MQYIQSNLLSGFCQGHRHAWAKVPNRAMNTKKFISPVIRRIQTARQCRSVVQGQWWVCGILWLRFYNFEMFYDVIRILTNNNCCSQPERLGGREGGWRKIVTIERRDQNLGSNCKKIKVENELVFSTGNASYIKLSGFYLFLRFTGLFPGLLLAQIFLEVGEKRFCFIGLWISDLKL